MEKIFKDYIEGYVNIHNELIDLDTEDKSSEIERLKKVIEANDMLVQNSMKVEDIDSNDKAKHKEFEIESKQYMENIKNAEKEIEFLNKQREDNLKRKEQLEQGQKNIRELAKEYKEEKIKEEKQRRLDEWLRNKVYEYNAQEYKINQELEKFLNIDLETTQQEIERIQLEGELRKIQTERKKVEQQLNQETDLIKKIEKEYILFLGQLSLIDKNNEKILVETKQEETKQEEVKKRMLVEKQKNSEMNNIANEKETVANEKNIDNDVEKKAKKEKLDSLKTKAKENNETESKSENNGFRTYDTGVAKDNVKINEGEGKENLANEEVENEEIEKGNIDEIIINEGNGEVVISFKDGRKLNRDLNEILEEKKDTYIKENVKEICENIAGSKIRGLLLRTKINPAIIDVLSKYSDSDMIQEYVECLNEKRKMPFDLVHDLRDSKLGVINKLKMWVHAKAEDKIPGTKVTFAGMFWNKNKAIAEKSEVKNERESAEQTEAKRDKVQDRIKVDNKDNKLEHTANSNLDEKETQEKIAESVKEIMDEEKVL